MGVYSVDKLIAEARRIAAEYRRATGKSLGGVSGEIAENDAARLLDLEVCKEKTGGYDAVGRGAREGRRIQIKGRALFEESKGQRIGQLKLDQEWDSVMLVLMDDDFEPIEIYEAERQTIIDAMAEQSSSRKKRGAMSVAKFRHIAQRVWSRDSAGLEQPVAGEQAGH